MILTARWDNLSPADLPENLRAEYRSLSQEENPEIRAEALLSLGRRLASAHEPETASRILAQLVQSGAREVAPEIRARAQAHLDALSGRGANGARAEVLLRHLTRDVLEPSTLVGMTAASTAFRLTRLASLASYPGIGGVLAGLAGFGVEALVFPLASRGASFALGRELDWSAGVVGREIASSFLVLGSMKVAGLVAGFGGPPLPVPLPRGERGLLQGAFRGTELGLGRGLFRETFRQGAMLGGIVLGHQLEEVVGLRPHLDRATTWTDSLAMLLQFHAAGRLSQGLLGPGFRTWEHSLELRTLRLGDLRIPTLAWSRLLPISGAAAGLLTLLNPLTAQAAVEMGERSSSTGWWGLGGSLLTIALGAVVYRGTRRGGWLGGAWRSIAPEAPEGLSDLVEFHRNPAPQRAPALSARNNEAFNDTILSLKNREVSDAAGLALLLEVLQADWLGQIEARGVALNTISLKEFRDLIVMRGGRVPEWMLPMLTSAMGEYAEIHETYVGAAQINGHRPVRLGDAAFFNAYAFSGGLITFFESLLGLPSKTLYESLPSGGMVLRYLPPGILLEMGRNLYGHQAVNLRVVPEIIEGPAMRRLVAADERPMLVSKDYQNVHSQENTHPYVAWEHDVFHVLKVGRFPRGVRSEWAKLQEAVLALSYRFPEEEEIPTLAEDGLFDGEYSDAGSNGRFFAHIYRRSPGPEYLRALRRELLNRFSGHPRESYVIEAFEATFGPSYR